MNEAVVAPDDIMGEKKPQAGPLSRPLGGEVGVVNALQCGAVHAATGVADGDPGVMARPHVEARFDIPCRHFHLFDDNGKDAALNLDRQHEIYELSIRDAYWNRFIRRIFKSNTTMALLGVPRQQRQQVELHFGGGIAEFIEQRIDEVFSRLPIQDNYFWRVYLKGEYTPECCPNYLKPEHFAALKAGLVDRISVHTQSVEDFLRQTSEPITRFVLLDHMDWLSTFHYPALESEWQAIVNRAAPSCHVLFRSGGLKVHYLDAIRVTTHHGQYTPRRDASGAA